MNQPTNPNQFGNYPFPQGYPQQYGNVNPTQSPTGYQQGPYQPTQAPLQVPVPPSMPAGGPQIPGMLSVEESYIENILRLNKGKLVTIYTTFENNREWNAKIFKGIIEAAGRDHIIISDPQTGLRYLIPMVYLDYISFEEEIEYEYPFGSGQANMASYPPR